MPTDKRGNEISGPHKATPQSDQRAQWEIDQQAISHADGFIGPRIGEVYKGRNNNSGTPNYSAPTLQGGQQPNPASGLIYEKGGVGTAHRMAHLDDMLKGSDPRMLQHKATGNIIETWQGVNSRTVNDYGTSASGVSMQPHNDVNMNPGGRYGAGIDHTSEDYTDVTDVIRGTESYKKGKATR